MPHLGPMEITLIVILVLIVFGVGKLPQVGGALGKGIREFRKGKAEDPDGDSEIAKGKTGEKSEEKKES